MKDCEICPIIETHNGGEDVQVLQTEYWRAVLDADQRTLGKMFVTLLEHKESISELSEDEWRDLYEIMKTLENSVKNAFDPSHFNWQCLMNNAVVADESTHVHWHFHPRYKAPVEFDGEILYDTELYSPKKRTTHVVDKTVLEKIKSEIIGG